MRIIFKTNIDKYRTVSFPPRKGEMVYVMPEFNNYCQTNRMPNRLEVCAVRYEYSTYHKETVAHVELWFNETDFKLYGGGEKLLS